MKVDTDENCTASAITVLHRAPLFLQMNDKRILDAVGILLGLCVVMLLTPVSFLMFPYD